MKRLALLVLLMAAPAAAQEAAPTHKDAAPIPPPSGAPATAGSKPPQLSPNLLPTPVAKPSDDAGGADASPTADAYGAFQRGYYLSALRIAEPLANLGDPAAQTLLGEIYGRGLGVPRDEIESARWYGVAAKAGVPEAQFRYAMLLIEGRAVPPDDATARDLMKAAADAGNPLAAYNYGQMLIRASPTGGFAEAAGYFRKAADSGLADAQYALSQLYAYGRGFDKSDDAQARKWLSEAAKGGSDTAQIELGIWLINGRGGEKDPVEGFRWLKGAAERGNPIAVNRLAHLYKDGVGTVRDRAKAAMWAVMARRASNSDSALDKWFASLPTEEQKAALEAANRTPTG